MSLFPFFGFSLRAPVIRRIQISHMIQKEWFICSTSKSEEGDVSNEGATGENSPLFDCGIWVSE